MKGLQNHNAVCCNEQLRIVIVVSAHLKRKGEKKYTSPFSFNGTANMFSIKILEGSWNSVLTVSMQHVTGKPMENELDGKSLATGKNTDASREQYHFIF